MAKLIAFNQVNCKAFGRERVKVKIVRNMGGYNSINQAILALIHVSLWNYAEWSWMKMEVKDEVRVFWGN